MSVPNRGTLWAGALADELARHGVRDVCVAPGSRSTPLVLAFARDDRCRLYTHFDERSAGFFAVGLARGRGTPVAVVTTSGTAVANLYPAVIEASHAGVPLIVLSADRPGDLRGTDANQTVNQVRMFGDHARAFFDTGAVHVSGPALRHLRALVARAVAAAVGAPSGPVQVNVPLDKPLEPTFVPGDVPADFAAAHPLAAGGRPGGAPFTEIGARPTPAGHDLDRVHRVLDGTGRGLIVAGPLRRGAAGRATVALARRSAWPLLADPLSGARFTEGAGEVSLGAYDAFLRDAGVRERLRPDAILRFGPLPTSTAVQDYLEAHPHTPQIVVDDGIRWPDATATASEVIRTDPAAFATLLAARVTERADAGWRRCWWKLERAARAALARELGAEPFEARAVVAALDAAAAAGTWVFIGNSMPVRDLDRYTGPRDREIPVYGNRGASGIDGLVSSALGTSAALGRPGVAILGDLSLLHDQNGLFAARERGVTVVFVVLHNDGGGIFHMLPIREHEPEFTRHVVVPHGLEPRRVAALFDLGHAAVRLDDDIGGAVARALQGGKTTVIEIRTDRETNRRRQEETLAAVRRAVDADAGDSA